MRKLRILRLGAAILVVLSTAAGPAACSSFSPSGAGVGGRDAAVACQPSVLVLSDAGGPEPCAYGEVCSQDGGVCVAAPSCEIWEPAAAGPVIVGVKVTTSPRLHEDCDASTFGPWGAAYDVVYYAPRGFVAESYETLKAHVRVHTSTDPVDRPPWFHRGDYFDASTTGHVTFGSCSPEAPNAATIHFTDESGVSGNRACVSF